MNCSVNRCAKPVKSKGKCRKHHLLEWRQANPIKYAYQTLKDNAKRRGKPFDLTLEQFEAFSIETKYIIGKGRTPTSLHIDRINEDGGYTMDNIQILDNSENIKKFLRWSMDQRGKPYHFINEIIVEKKHGHPFNL